MADDFRLAFLQQSLDQLRRYLPLSGYPDMLVPRTQSVTAAYTAADDLVLLADATAGAFSITLPPVADSFGKLYAVKKTDASVNAVTLDGNASETIDGATTFALSAQYDWCLLVAGPSEWHILARKSSAGAGGVAGFDSSTSEQTHSGDTDYTDSDCAATVVAPTAGTLLVWATCKLHIDSGGPTVSARVYDGSNQYGGVVTSTGESYGDPLTIVGARAVAAGTYTLTLRYKTSNGSNAAYIDQKYLNVLFVPS